MSFTENEDLPHPTGGEFFEGLTDEHTGFNGRKLLPETEDEYEPEYYPDDYE